MGRPPCCDKDGIKKGPWTPEEDIILESYISEHGPGNWRLVPANTGLLRCSKSCRLRWTNYLRPGIKRGNFTTHEEKLIVYLQSKLGNKWASIASYLPQRTDNDIKNYWNTHLKKKTKKYQSALDPILASSLTTSHFITRRYVDKRSKDLSNQAPLFRFNQASTYASSTENISRLLEGWMKSSPNSSNDLGKTQEEEKNNSSSRNNNIVGSSTDNNADQQENCDVISNEELESLLSFDNISNMSWEKSSTESKTIYTDEKFKTMSLENDEEKLEDEPPFSLLEKWLLEESAGQVEDLMNLSPIF